MHRPEKEQVSQNPGKQSRDDQDNPLLAEELLIIEDCWERGRKEVFKDAAPEGLPMLQDTALLPYICGHH